MQAIADSSTGYRAGRLRLLHVIHMLDPAAGGAVAAVKSMCAALADRGHDVTLCATEAPARLGDAPGNYRTLAFPMAFAPMAFSLGFAKALTRHKNVDLVHIHQLYRFPQSWAALFCRRHNIPYCIQPHGSLEPVLYHKRERRTLKRLYEKLVENRNLQHAAGLIYTAQGEKEAVNFLNLRAPAFVVPLGLDVSTFDPAAAGFRSRHGLDDSELIVWMGRLVPVKALDVLITAFAALARRRPRAVLALIGPDPENHAEKLRGLMKDLALDPQRVIFGGMLLGRDKLAALKEADIFVLPSYTENFGLAAVEAMAMGRPVIVSTGVKIAPDIARAGAGLVIKPEPESLEIAMNQLLEDEDKRRRMGEAARAFALQHDWPVVVGRLEEAYRTMIGP